MFARHRGNTKKASHRLLDLTKNRKLDQDVAQWASRTLCAVQNDKVHDLWTNAIPGVVSWRDMQPLFDKRFVNDNDVLAELAMSLKFVLLNEEVLNFVQLIFSNPSDPNLSYLANRYLEYPMKQVIEDVALQIRRLLRHDETLIAERYAPAHIECADADRLEWQEMCGMLSVKQYSNVQLTVSILSKARTIIH